MDGRAAIVGAIAVAAVGLLAYLVLGGVAGGMALFVAGLLVVAIGLLGWHDRRVTAAGRTGERADHLHEGPITADDALLGHLLQRHPEVSLDSVTLELRRLHEHAHGRSEGS